MLGIKIVTNNNILGFIPFQDERTDSESFEYIGSDDMNNESLDLEIADASKNVRFFFFTLMF